VVWPEAAYPYRIPHGSRDEPPGAGPVLAPGVHGPVLTGLLLTGAPGGSAYNSAVVASRGAGLSTSYDKRHLLWFGETVPLADRFHWIRVVFARGLGLAPGDRSVALAAGRVRASPLICYEDILPEAGREAMAERPNLLVNITNDAWFGGGESELHLRMAALRSIEVRRDMVRAVNRGIPSWFDAAGRLRARGSPDFPGTLQVEPALLDTADTPYVRFGDAPWALAALLLANLAVWRAARRSDD
jgi:apolipoprotein N-acyltransferase